MELFTKREETETDVIYTGNRYNLEDEGEEERKFCYTLVKIRELMNTHPDNDELKKIYARVKAMAEHSWKDAEELIMLRGMDKILYDLARALAV